MSANVAIGFQGNATYFYWVIARYPIGQASPSNPAIVNFAPSPPTSTARITVSWRPVTGATGYDVLKTINSTFPSGGCTCALVSNTASSSVADTGQTLTSYTISTITQTAGVVTLNNQDEAKPFFPVQLLNLQDRLRWALIQSPFTAGNCPQFGPTGGYLVDSGGPCGAGASGYTTVQDEGTALTQRRILNFIGTPVTCVDNAGSLRTDCTVSGGGSGTVTSVGLTMPAEFAVAGSPVTTAGTLAVTKATQVANFVFAGPTTGAAAAPTFRALVLADMPSGLPYSIVQDEGIALTSRPALNFVGTGVTCVDNAGASRTDCTIPAPSSVAPVTFSLTGPGFAFTWNHALGTQNLGFSCQDSAHNVAALTVTFVDNNNVTFTGGSAGTGPYTCSALGGTLATTPATPIRTDFIQIITGICQGGTAGTPASGTPGSGTSFFLATAPSPTCETGTNTESGSLAFTASQAFQYRILLPPDWYSAAGIDIYGRWLSTGTTGSAIFDIQLACAIAGGSGDPAFGAVQAVTVAAQGTTNNLNTLSQSGLTVPGACAANADLFLKFTFDAASTTTGVRVTNVRLAIRRQ